MAKTKTAAEKPKTNDETTKAVAKRVNYNRDAVVGSDMQLKALVTTGAFETAIRESAPKHLDSGKLVRMILAAAIRNPRLLQCTQGSILKGAVEASALGLDCSGLLGRGYMVPFKNGALSQAAGQPVYEATFMPGYLGLCDLARRSGEIVKVEAKAVYKGDIFEYEEGIDQKLLHKPNLSPTAGKTKAALQFVYAIGTFKTGEKQFVVMTIPEVEMHRERSRAKSSGPWVTDYIAMALKTVTRQLCKWLPQSPDLAEALKLEADAENRAMVDSDVIVEGVNAADTLTKRLEVNGKGDDPEPAAEPTVVQEYAEDGEPIPDSI